MGKHLDFYKKCVKDGNRMPYHYGHYNGGLCGIAYNSDLIDKELLELFRPIGADVLKYETAQSGFWGYGKIGFNYATEFTALRQTIVLFMAAMNNEL
jgi:hypothetical protein